MIYLFWSVSILEYQLSCAASMLMAMHWRVRWRPVVRPEPDVVGCGLLECRVLVAAAVLIVVFPFSPPVFLSFLFFGFVSLCFLVCLLALFSYCFFNCVCCDCCGVR